MFLEISQTSQENTYAGFSFFDPANLLKMRLQHRYLSVKIGEFLRRPIFIEQVTTTGSVFFFFPTRLKGSSRDRFCVTYLF